MRITVPISAFAFVLATQPFIAQSPVPKEENKRISTSVNQHATAGGPEILSDTQGVDFGPWLKDWLSETKRTWLPLIPDEVNPPKLEQGKVAIRFTVLPNGRLKEGGMVLEGRSAYTALDRAAWGALVGSKYPPLPSDFHGPYLEIRAYFFYNMKPPR